MPVEVTATQRIAATTAAIYERAEQNLIGLVTRQLTKGDIESDHWAVQRLAQVGALRRAAAAIVARLEVDGSAALRRAVAQAYRAGNNGAIADLTATLAPRLFTPALAAARDHRGGNAIQAIAAELVGEVKPLHARILPAVESAYRRVIAAATTRSVLGIQPRRRAAQDAWAALVDQGITSFVDGAGHRRRLSSYVEMATRTAALRAATTAQVDEFTAAGQRLIYVEDRPGECHLCRPWEHQVLALWGATGDVLEPTAVHVKATLAEALAAGLQHPNCGHRIRLYVPGRTRLSRYTQDPKGNAVRVRQRTIERHIRHWRERELSALIPEDRQRAQTRVAMWRHQLQAHLEGTGVPRLKYREEPGAGHVPAARKREAVDLQA